jgi:hypothetical protein
VLETLNALARKLEEAVAAKDQERHHKYQIELLPLMSQGPDICDDERQAERKDMTKQVRDNAACLD